MRRLLLNVFYVLPRHGGGKRPEYQTKNKSTLSHDLFLFFVCFYSLSQPDLIFQSFPFILKYWWQNSRSFLSLPFLWNSQSFIFLVHSHPFPCFWSVHYSFHHFALEKNIFSQFDGLASAREGVLGGNGILSTALHWPVWPWTRLWSAPQIVLAFCFSPRERLHAKPFTGIAPLLYLFFLRLMTFCPFSCSPHHLSLRFLKPYSFISLAISLTYSLLCLRRFLKFSFWVFSQFFILISSTSGSVVFLLALANSIVFRSFARRLFSFHWKNDANDRRGERNSSGKQKFDRRYLFTVSFSVKHVSNGRKTYSHFPSLLNLSPLPAVRICIDFWLVLFFPINYSSSNFSTSFSTKKDAARVDVTLEVRECFATLDFNRIWPSHISLYSSPIQSLTLAFFKLSPWAS